MKIGIGIVFCLVVLAVSFPAGCRNAPSETAEIKTWAVNSTSEVLTQSGVEADGGVTSDGGGSLRLTATSPTTFRLFETGDIDIENSRLIYQARVKTQDVNGEVYLEMWCHFAGKGEFFSRALHAPLSGSVDWTTQETPFSLRKGENPDNVKLNLVVSGTGTAWIDDIRLIRCSM